MKKKALILLGILLFLVGKNVFSADIPASDIVKNFDDLMRGDSTRGTYTMTIVTPSWTRELKLAVQSLGRDHMFIRILSPQKEQGTGSLRIGNEMWNYLPRVEKLIKIPPSLMLQPWMGSDFANDDLVKESSIVDDYTHEIIQEESLDDPVIYTIESTPRPGSPVIWGKIIRWIRADFVPLREEYYDEHMNLLKVLEFSDIGPVSDRVIPRVWTMTSMTNAGHSTTIRVMDDVEYNTYVSSDVFTLQNLKSNP